MNTESLMNTHELHNKKLDNEKKILGLMPLELWRLVDDFAEARSHTLLRGSCSFFRRWLTWKKAVEFAEYKMLNGKMRFDAWNRKGNAFQAAVCLNLHTVKQEHYDYLCRMNCRLEVIRICRSALLDPFTCAHIDLSVYGNFAIRVASEYGHTLLVQLLLQDPRVDPSAEYNFSIKVASEYGHTLLVQLLLQDPRVDPSANDNWAFTHACQNGHSGVVQLLLQDPRVDPNAPNNELIIRAASRGYLAVIQVLLQDPRVDPSVCDNYAIRCAALNGHNLVVRLLLHDSRVDPAARNNYALRNAVIFENNFKEVCDLLLSDPRVVAAYHLDPFDLPSGIQVPPLPTASIGKRN